MTHADHAEYFAILAARGGGAAVAEVVHEIAPTWWNYCRDGDQLLAARAKLARRIIASP